jgi:hypothetical protein
VGHEGCPPMFTRAVHSADILLTIHCAMYAARRRHLKHAFSFLKQSPWCHAPSFPNVYAIYPTLPRRHGFTGASMVVVLLGRLAATAPPPRKASDVARRLLQHSHSPHSHHHHTPGYACAPRIPAACHLPSSRDTPCFPGGPSRAVRVHFYSFQRQFNHDQSATPSYIPSCSPWYDR